MILSLPEITAILLKNPHAKRMEVIKKYASKLIMHNTGKGKEKFIEEMSYFESPRLLQLRQKYSPSNEDFFSRLHRPLDKIFNAKGGAANYYLPDSQKPKLMELLKNVADGYSIRRWVETFWLPSYNYDPMGLIMMEVANGNTYPTYKCSLDIYAYPPSKGRQLDYVIFEDKGRTEQAKESKDYTGATYFRVVDDAYDYMIKWDGKQAQVVQAETYQNYFGHVPAITVGDMYDNVKGFFVSPDDEIIDLADQYMRDRSVMTMFQLHHGFPLRWAYRGQCPTCKGTTKIAGNDCPSCNGSGNKSSYDVAETIVIPIPDSKEDPILAPNIAGYVTPPIETWVQMQTSIDGKYKEAHFASWGTNQVEDSAAQATATGRFIDVQPVNERLGKYSDAGEYVETWITNMVGAFNFEGSYKGSDINYGRRYLIESPDDIWKKYQDARAKGVASVGSLNNMLMQYIQSEYQSDSVEQLRQIKCMKLEPFVHMTVDQCKMNVQNISDYYKKLYFSNWLSSLQPNDLIVYDLPTLDKMLTDYTAPMVAAYEPPAPATIKTA